MGINNSSFDIKQNISGIDFAWDYDKFITLGYYTTPLNKDKYIYNKVSYKNASYKNNTIIKFEIGYYLTNVIIEKKYHNNLNNISVTFKTENINGDVMLVNYEYDMNNNQYVIQDQLFHYYNNSINNIIIKNKIAYVDSSYSNYKAIHMFIYIFILMVFSLLYFNFIYNPLTITIHP